jgi:deoxyhypusine synthase
VKDIEVVMEEPLMRYNSCTSKKYKKKEIIRVDDVLIKNVSISNIDNVLWNSIEKLYHLNKDFIRLSDNLESDIDSEEF